MTPTPPAAPTVLIVEDDALTRRALSIILQGKGYRVQTAANGQAALEQLRAGPRPCLILLDLVMPVLDGMGFRAAQRSDPAVADIPVVVVSGVPGGRGQAAVLQSADYFDKPVDTDALLDAVRRLCPTAP
jgi:CheY-like chemotaxis protein